MPTRQEVEAEKQAALNKGMSQPIFAEIKLRLERTGYAFIWEEPAPPPQALSLSGEDKQASPQEAGILAPVTHKAYWLLCFLIVGIVPPRTKSPAEEEMTTSAVVRRTSKGLTNGLSSQVSIHPQALGALCPVTMSTQDPGLGR